MPCAPPLRIASLMKLGVAHKEVAAQEHSCKEDRDLREGEEAARGKAHCARCAGTETKALGGLKEGMTKFFMTFVPGQVTVVSSRGRPVKNAIPETPQTQRARLPSQSRNH